MARTAISSLARATARSMRPHSSLTAPRSLPIRQPALQISRVLSISPARTFSSTRATYKGLSPESEDPQPIPKQPLSNTATKPTDITAQEYEELSNSYMDFLVEKLEELQEEKEEVDVEYSSGVLTLKFPPAGTYVINKQPPNKQIWLSSPISGPKRYDYVVVSEGQDAKEDTGAGIWVYLRDGSTLAGLLETELGIDLSKLEE